MSTHIKIILVFVHFLVWFGMYLLLSPIPLSVVAVEFPPLSSPEISIFLFYGFGLNIALIYTYAHIAFPAYLRQPKLSFLFLLNLIFLLFFSLLESTIDFMFFDYVYEVNQYPDAPQSFEQLSMSNLVLNFFMLLSANLYGLAYAWFREVSARRALEREKLKAELSALKHQIHPHFLFNILNGLYGLAYKNDDEPTAEGIAKLSQMMRYMLYESNEEKVPLHKEIQYIEHYIDLQRLRMDGMTQIEFEIDGKPEGKLIVPMILIPFIENAFKHGVSTVHASQIMIHLNLEGDQLVFLVENTVHRLPSNAIEASSPGGIGLQNVVKRLQLVYKQTYQLDIDATEISYKVTLSLPI